MGKRIDFWLWLTAAGVFALGAATRLVQRDWAGVALGFSATVTFGLVALRYWKAGSA
jgi:hypothetical protein